MSAENFWVSENPRHRIRQPASQNFGIPRFGTSDRKPPKSDILKYFRNFGDFRKTPSGVFLSPNSEGQPSETKFWRKINSHPTPEFGHRPPPTPPPTPTHPTPPGGGGCPDRCVSDGPHPHPPPPTDTPVSPHRPHDVVVGDDTNLCDVVTLKVQKYFSVHRSGFSKNQYIEGNSLRSFDQVLRATWADLGHILNRRTHNGVTGT